eukprot:1147048-Pelagomonas_calceolata.AAC.3
MVACPKPAQCPSMEDVHMKLKPKQHPSNPLTAVVPAAGPPGTAVKLIGTAPWTIRRDCDQEAAAGPNDESCVGEVVFGDYLCDTGAGTDDASSIIDIRPDLPRYNDWNQYSVRCTLPDPSNEAETMVRGTEV